MQALQWGPLLRLLLLSIAVLSAMPQAIYCSCSHFCCTVLPIRLLLLLLLLLHKLLQVLCQHHKVGPQHLQYVVAQHA